MNSLMSNVNLCDVNLSDRDALQRDINAVHEWSVANRLHFNPSKCETMTFTRGRNPKHYHYFIGGEPVSRVERVRDLGVRFDPELTLREHTQRVVDAAHRRLGFVLRNVTPLSVAANKALYGALVRSILETNTVVWSPHEEKYILILEQVQKKFLRNLFRKVFNYYPYLYPSLYVQGHLGYQTLEVRRSLALSKFTLGIIRNKIDCTALVEVLLQISVPNTHTTSRLRDRPRCVVARAAGRTAHRRHSPVERARALLGSVLAAAPQCDLFASGIACVMRECKRMYEMHVRETSVPI
ncbi:hypothetical protein O0L34_g17298 [Tuta absoluta]|nr:hypothetical protein O0L34_g17298 [Tuta absoluta]